MRRHLPTLPPAGFVAMAALALAPGALIAQHDEPPPPAGYALQNVTVVDASGARRAGVTLVVRGSLIETLAPGVQVPGDVRLLEGDSLWVYPGFIDAEGEAEFEFPEMERDGPIPSWNPPRAAQGFTPHRRIADGLTAVGSDLDGRRKAGVVASAVFPDEGLSPGQGAVLLHRKSAALPRELVVRPTLGATFSLESARGVYPGTLFGVMAFHRQVFEDANRESVIMAAYQEDPTGIEVPAWDPDYEVYHQVGQGRMPVFFRAHGAEDIRRVIDLSDQYGFRPVIVGGGEAWKTAAELRERNIPVLVSVDFPEPREWEPPEDSEEPGPGEEGQDAATIGDAGVQEESEEEELEPAAWREKQRLEKLYANAGRLAEAGVTFALTSGGGDADIREGVRKAMEYGLDEGAAMAAVTTTPARLLGVPSLPRVAPGMAATFVVTNGPIFDEETGIAYTFVEGEMEKGDLRSGGTEPPAADLTGSWTVEMDSPQGTFEMTANFSQDGNDLSGTVSGDQFGAASIAGGNVSGSDVSFTIVIDAGGQTIEIRVQGDIENPNLFTGSARSPFGNSAMTATRQDPGGAR